MLNFRLSFYEERINEMIYKETEFQQLKEQVGDFLKNGFLGNIQKEFNQCYPYRREPENYLNELSRSDVRKAFVELLQKLGRERGIDIYEKAPRLMQQIEMFDLLDKESERDAVQALAWDYSMLVKKMDHREWENLRKIGESDMDVVRRSYGKCYSKEGREELLQWIEEYVEREHPLFDDWLGLSQVAVQLEELQGLGEKIHKSRERLLVDCEAFLKDQGLEPVHIQFILRKMQTDGSMEHFAVAYMGDTNIAYFSPYKNEVSVQPLKSFRVDEDFFQYLCDGYEIAVMTMEGHFDVWYGTYIQGIEQVNQEGFGQYLNYCVKESVSAELLDSRLGMLTPDIMAHLQKSVGKQQPERRR